MQQIIIHSTFLTYVKMNQEVQCHTNQIIH